MKHAGAATLDRLEPLLASLRAIEGLREPRRGVFYRAGRAWLHFHEDGAAAWADLRQGDDWVRLPVTSAAERRTLLERVRASLAGPATVEFGRRPALRAPRFEPTRWPPT